MSDMWVGWGSSSLRFNMGNCPLSTWFDWSGSFTFFYDSAEMVPVFSFGENDVRFCRLFRCYEAD